MGSTGDRPPDPTPASGSACLAQSTFPSWHLTSAFVFTERHPRPHTFATHPAVGGDGYARPDSRRQKSPHLSGCPLSRIRPEASPFADLYRLYQRSSVREIEHNNEMQNSVSHKGGNS